MDDNDSVYIKWKEYKELLILKGRYEELKSQQQISWTPVVNPGKTTITYTGLDGKTVSIPDNTTPKATW